VLGNRCRIFQEQVLGQRQAVQKIEYNHQILHIFLLTVNRLQDYNRRPHVTSGVWYEASSDTYNWIGPKFGRRMSEPASQFLSEVGPFLN
jgi:hypothetical protein